MSYIDSKKIKVYPTAYRGDNGASTPKMYNPESRLFTEQNIGRPYINLANYAKGDTKLEGSFVISKNKTDNPFKFVICGYYFEIVNDGTIFTDTNSAYYAQVKIAHQGTDDSENVSLYTNYLTSLDSSYTTLDNGDKFYGLDIIKGMPNDWNPAGDVKLLLLVDVGGIIPDTSLVKYAQYTLDGGDDKPLNKYLKTQDVRVEKTLKDTKSTHHTEIDFEDSSELIKTINATTSVTTPTTNTQLIDNRNTWNGNYEPLNIYSKEKILIQANDDGSPSTSLIELKTTGEQSSISLKTEKTKSDINLKAKDSIHLIAQGDGNTSGRYISLQSGEDKDLDEFYVLPSTSDSEPEPAFSSGTSHTLATREWIKNSFNFTSLSSTGCVNDILSVQDGLVSKTIQVAKVQSCITADNAVKAYVTSDTGKTYLVTATSSGNYLDLKRASSSIYASGTGFYATTFESTSTITAGSSFNAKSDKRLKDNIKSFEPHKSILDLPVVEFDFKSDKSHHIGCIAQDLQQICPEIVHTGEDGYLTIEENKIVYLLLDEVKKLKKEVEELKSSK